MRLDPPSGDPTFLSVRTPSKPRATPLPRGGGGNSLWRPIGGGSARKGYLFQASGIWNGRDFTSWKILESLSGGKRRDRERPRTSENQARKSVAPGGKLGINISCVLQSPLEKLKRNTDACAKGVKRCILGNMKMVNTYSRKMGGRPIWAQLRLPLTPTRDHERFNTISTETSVKMFRQMVLVFFFRTENRNGIKLYHLWP